MSDTITKMIPVLYDYTAEEEKVAPVVTYLAGQCREVSGYLSSGGFLYSRCVALINGPEYYEEAKAGKRKDMRN